MGHKHGLQFITVEWKVPPQLHCELVITIPYILLHSMDVFRFSLVGIFFSRSFAAKLAFGRLRTKNVTSLETLTWHPRESYISICSPPMYNSIWKGPFPFAILKPDALDKWLTWQGPVI
jgi:hypothetical protein